MYAMSGDNILVAIKSRPLISRETSQNLKPQWAVQDKTIFQIDEQGHRQSEPYSFDHIFTECMSNATVYNAVVEPLVKSFLNGFNSTIFAYGQTSSGKTHTMMGTDRIPGIIQLAINDVFQHVSCNIQRRYLISCSYFEIYNEKINDLLDKNGQDLKIREDYDGNTFIYSKEEVVTEAKQVYDLMKVGSKIRKIGCTNMNEHSSRSHTIFRLTIKSTENNVEQGPVQISYLNLVDLAGSERIAHTKAAGVRLKEGVNINKSLLALGNVIRQLSEGEGFINYRDSNLTRLLQHALGGNAKSLIIATITTAAGEETKSTLEFAQRAKIVKNKPVINEILSEQDKLKQYQLVTASYKDRLEKEKQRILEMENEKEEREREILRLKQQVKLIDLFTNGPEKQKIENRIPRRHTMGHYTSRIPLETIPESKIMTMNIMQEESIDNDLKCDLIDEELTVKMLMDESLDEGILPITPEPPAELLEPIETTPVSHLRERLKHLEESYISLQEFTQLESQCRDKDLVCDLVVEKENLLKDIIDLNSIVKDTRQEKEQMKMRFEEELIILKNDLVGVKKQNDKLSLALIQAENEKDALKLAKEQLLNDNEVLLEQQKLKYENRLEYFTKEIETLNKQTRTNEDTKLNTNRISIETEEKSQRSEKEEENYDILSVATQTEEVISDNKIITYKEYEELKEEMEQLRQNSEDNVSSYKEKIKLKDVNICELTNKITNLEENLESYMEERNTYKKEVDSKKIELTVQTDKILQIENEISKYQDELEASAKRLRDQEDLINDFNKKLTPLEQQIKKLVLENDSYKEEIQILKKEVPLKDDEIIELKSKLDAIQMEQSENVSDLVTCRDEIEMKSKEITALLNKLDKFEKDNMMYKEEIVSKENTIITINEKMSVLEKDTPTLIQKMEQLQEEIKVCKDDNAIIKEQVSIKDQVISELNHTITNLEKMNDKDKEEIQFREEKILKLSDEIKDLENDILKLTNKIEEEKCNNEEIQKRNNEILECLQTKDNEILELTDNVKSLEKCNIENKMEIETRNTQILELEDKIKELETNSLEYIETSDNKILELTRKINDMEQSKEEVMVNNDEILKMKTEMDSLKKSNTENKEYIKLKEKEIVELESKIKDLEQNNEDNKEEISIKNDETIRLKNEINHLKETNNENAEYIQKKNSEILELKNKIKDLELCCDDNKEEIRMKNDETTKLRNELNENKEYIKEKDYQIVVLQNKLKDLENNGHGNKEYIQAREDMILKLTEKVKDLEKFISDSKAVIQAKDTEILELTNKIKNLEHDSNEEIRIKDHETAKLKNEMNNLKKYNNEKNEYIQKRDKDILELNNKINDLEQNNNYKEEEIRIKNNETIKLRNEINSLKKDNNENILKRDNQILELHNKIKDFERCINDNKAAIQAKDDDILQLNNRLRDLEKYRKENKECIQRKDIQILELTDNIKDLKKSHEQNKEYMQMKDKKILDLTNKLEELEKLKREQIQIKDMEILELTNKISRYKKEIHSMERIILELNDRIRIMDDLIKESKTGTTTENNRSSVRLSSSSSSLDLSPKELRKIKRQSIHDQRRGIDLAEVAAACNANEESITKDEDLKGTVKKLKEKIKELTQENGSLEWEVQGFIRELDDCNKYRKELDKEIDVLNEQIEKLKKGQGLGDCKECPQKQHYIKKLEGLQRDNKFKIVELQTKIYDLQNSYKEDKINSEERERQLRYYVTKLEARLENKPTPLLKSTEIQCELTDIDQLLEKYSLAKKVARMRRNEANILRAKLGMDPDEPVT